MADRRGNPGPDGLGKRPDPGRWSDFPGRIVAIPPGRSKRRAPAAVVSIQAPRARCGAGQDLFAGNDGRSPGRSAQHQEADPRRPLPAQRLHGSRLVSTRRRDSRRLARQARDALAGAGPLGIAGLAGRQARRRRPGQPQRAPRLRSRHERPARRARPDAPRGQHGASRPGRVRLRALRRHADRHERNRRTDRAGGDRAGGDRRPAGLSRRGAQMRPRPGAHRQCDRHRRPRTLGRAGVERRRPSRCSPERGGGLGRRRGQRRGRDSAGRRRAAVG